MDDECAIIEVANELGNLENAAYKVIELRIALNTANAYIGNEMYHSDYRTATEMREALTKRIVELETLLTIYQQNEKFNKEVAQLPEPPGLGALYQNVKSYRYTNGKWINDDGGWICSSQCFEKQQKLDLENYRIKIELDAANAEKAESLNRKARVEELQNQLATATVELKEWKQRAIHAEEMENQFCTELELCKEKLEAKNL